ncbi:rhodanese-like domain-containing protein [Oleispirillum naphthae]|uniref:rhodanese-like domain-containing protein n=1 Tax=Oleispirillum naphthae TaxID=2838853 RepID=UPI0030825954
MFGRGFLAALFALAAMVCFSGAALAASAVAVENLKPAEAWSKLQRGEAILIDVRTQGEWQQTGVPRAARRVTLSDPRGAAGFVAGVGKAVRGDLKTPVMLICRTGNRSAAAAKLLVAAGFRSVYNVTEGVIGNGSDTGWAWRGLPMAACGVCAAQN